MAATAAQIAAGRQLASSRGYDPNLVDADNADRANSAFPVQQKPAAPASGGSIVKAPVPVDKAAPIAAPSPMPGPPPATSNGEASTQGIVAAAGPVGGSAGPTGAVPAATPAAVGGDPMAALQGIQNVAGGGNDLATQKVGQFSLPDMYNLRPGLSTRSYPQDSMALAGIGRKVY